MKRFGVEDGLELKVKRRGAAPNGGGEVYFTCPVVRQLKPVQLVDEGKFKRIRGLAFTTKVAPSIAARVVESARGVFNHLIPDVFIYTDHYKGRDAGASPGFGCSLAAESTTGVVLCAEVVAQGATVPEELGARVAHLLCDEVQQGGCIDSTHQPMALLFMTLCTEDVSRLRIGKLSPYTIETLRHLKDFFGIVFKLKADAETQSVIASCLGVGFKNLAKASF
jgi:RNA 3'-terminal phosphate cyclase-like protein